MGINMEIENESNLEEMWNNSRNLLIFHAYYKGWLNRSQHDQNRSPDGSIIPDKLKMDLNTDSGFFFGMKPGE